MQVVGKSESKADTKPRSVSAPTHGQDRGMCHLASTPSPPGGAYLLMGGVQKAKFPTFSAHIIRTSRKTRNRANARLKAIKKTVGIPLQNTWPKQAKPDPYDGVAGVVRQHFHHTDGFAFREAPSMCPRCLSTPHRKVPPIDYLRAKKPDCVFQIRTASGQTKPTPILQK